MFKHLHPDHTGVPDTAMLISVEDLSLNNTTGDVIVSGSITGVMYVQVFDSTMRCPYSSGGTLSFRNRSIVLNRTASTTSSIGSWQ